MKDDQTRFQQEVRTAFAELRSVNKTNGKQGEVSPNLSIVNPANRIGGFVLGEGSGASNGNLFVEGGSNVKWSGGVPGGGYGNGVPGGGNGVP